MLTISHLSTHYDTLCSFDHESCLSYCLIISVLREKGNDLCYAFPVQSSVHRFHFLQLKFYCYVLRQCHCRARIKLPLKHNMNL